MSNVPAVVDLPSANASAWSPLFEPVLAQEVQRVIGRLDARQRLWLSGYLAGNPGATTQSTPTRGNASAATVIYGSHSGNCEALARRIGQALASRQLGCTVLDMLDCRKTHLQDTQHLLVIVSTHGEGDPPDRARPLYDLLHGRKAPKLSHLAYSVLALGDSSYEKFCETGRRFDAQLEALGARRLHERVECDVDFEATSQAWIDAVADKLARELAPGASEPAASTVARPSAALATAYTRKNPFRAPVLVNQRLTTRESTKDVRHIELSIEGAGIHYEPGDALGVVPRNRAEAVAALLDAVRFDGDETVTVGGAETTLREALTDYFEIGLLTRPLVERYAVAAGVQTLKELLEPEHASQLQQFLRGRDLIDLVLAHPPAGLDAPAFVQVLRPFSPRLYSIASSARETPDEVHLTVSVIAYESAGRQRQGVVSGALAALTDADVACVYPHRNPGFRLPADHDAAIIMIGAGTGVAPFRAFVAEREALGASGRNWLFFGERSFRSDFLYQAEWLDWRKRGRLERIDVAFSRDGAQKVYVQHRMRERGRDLFAWMETGAHVYVCGDAHAMAPDVERALEEIVQQHGGRTAEQAREYIQQMQRDRRYQKDVY